MTVNPDRQIIYKSFEYFDLKLHVFLPKKHKKSAKKPIILFFHGGGWINGSPKQFYHHCRFFTSRGMVAISAEYRIEEKHGTTPYESVMDAKSAIRFIRKSSSELGVDPKRLVCGGASAGAHIAAAGCSDKINELDDDLSISTIPSALVLFNPVIDNSPGEYGHERVKAYWDEFSPVHNIYTNHPPTVVFIGTEDKLIPLATIKRYCNMIEKVGRHCELHLYERQTHGFFNWLPEGNEYYNKTLIELDNFLVALGYLTEMP